MALYDGFFDAELNEDTYQYDREYNAGDFTGYFAHTVGSGVCIYNNVSSFLVTWDGSAAVISPGYLFIEGHWLKNDGYYSVPLSGADTHAVLAFLNTGARRIEIITQPKADPESYPGCLCLAYVTTDGAGGGVVEDTRYNTDICGVIDAAGSLSTKVEYAIWYIDNEIEGRLEAAEKDIEDKGAVLDERLAEVTALVDRLSPPPIGTVKFSASSSIEEGWLRCDGSFVSETDYPELVAALGKHIPAGNEFTEAVGGTLTGYFSTSVVYDGRCWVYHIDTATLYGFSLSGDAVKEIPVTGADALTASAANPVVMSICGGTVYLAQARSFILYESSESLDDKPASLSFTKLDTTVFPGEYFVPEVVQTGAGGPLYLCMGMSNTSSSFVVSVLSWQKDDFSAAVSSSFTLGSFGSSSLVDYSIYVSRYVKQLFRFSRKNANEMFYLVASTADTQNPSLRSIETVSYPQGVFSNASTTDCNTNGMKDDAVETSAVCYNGTYIYRVMLSNKTLTIRAGTYQPQAPFDPTNGKEQVLPLSLPSAARLFPDSVECAESQGLWMIFVGTGIAFSKEPLNLSSWGYLDTASVLGVITAFGGIEYDEYTNTLCVVGRDSTSRLKVGFLRFDDIYDYANDGAWLPMIASDGVPAYIKAFEPVGV